MSHAYPPPYPAASRGHAADASFLPRDLREALAEELSPAERLLWVGQPDPHRQMVGALPVLLFGVPWTAFSLLWTALAAGGLWSDAGGGGAPLGFKILFPLWGLPFVGIGLAMLAAPLTARRSAARTVYAVTDRRVLLFHAGRKRTARAYVPRFAAEMRRTERPDGSGDLTFAYDPAGGGGAGGTRGDAAATLLSPTFVGIPGVRSVETLLHETFLHGREPALGVGAYPGAHPPTPAGVGGTPPHWWTGADRAD